MTINVERFQKILSHIEDEEGRLRYDALEMSSWESACGTTYCIAGWVIYDETGQPLFNTSGTVHPSVIALAREVTPELGEGSGVDFALLGTRLLGLPFDLSPIFFADNETAYRFVKAAAGGAGWAELRDIVDGGFGRAWFGRA